MKQPQTLIELAELAVARHDASGRRLAELAQNEGFALASTTFNHIRAGRYKSTPTDETIRAIGWLAGVSDEVAFTAAGQPVPGPPLADELPPGSDNLSPKARKALIDMARLLIEYEAEDSHGSNTSKPDIPPAKLRAVAPTGDPRPGQKTGPPGGDDIELSIDQLGIKQLHGDEATEAPLGAAAHPHFETTREKFERLHGERGEENQDSWSE